MKLYLFLILLSLLTVTTTAQSDNRGKTKREKVEWIYPGEIWPDNNGNHVQAHGGGIVRWKNTFYWYGEQRAKDLDPKYKYVSCYSSKDLMNWTFRGNVLKMLPPDSIPALDA